MTVVSKTIKLSSQGRTDIIDISDDVEAILSAGSIENGIVTISVVGSTGAITTCEYEPGLVADLKEFFDKIIPPGEYHHDKAWGDGNGHSHLRASLVGPSLSLPLKDRRLILGTWQQIIFIDFDNRPRNREIVVQILGE